MKTLMSVAAVAALLTGGSILAAHAADKISGGRIHLAQSNSPGDGLDGAPASGEGNARPGGRGSAGPRDTMSPKPARKKRSRT